MEAEARADERAKIYEERKMSAPSVYKEAEDAVKIKTAKQIFTELDKAVWVQIEPSRLEEFYEQFSNAKDLKASLNVATAFGLLAGFSFSSTSRTLRRMASVAGRLALFRCWR